MVQKLTLLSIAVICVLSAFAQTQPRIIDNPQARLEFEILRTKDPITGNIPPGIRQRELNFMQKQTKRFAHQFASADLVTSWSHRGPYNVGGRTRALAIDIRNENIILAGGVSGGMWRSVDQGVNWIKTTAIDELQSVTCLTQDPREGQEDVWYYGTGELRGNSAGAAGAPFRGDGIWKSIDNGITWNVLESTSTNVPQSFDQDFDYNHEIVVNPTNGDVMVANFGGLYLSENGGDSFNLVLANNGGQWSDVVVSSAGIYYAALDNSGIFTSADGIEWINITDSSFTFQSQERIELAIAPSNEAVVYALKADGAVWKYNGTNWDDRSANIPAFEGAGPGNWNSQGSYNMIISVKPQDENFVVIGGTNLYRSTDGFGSSNNTAWIGGYGQSSFLYSNQHPDQHSFVWLPGENRAISGNDGGVQITQNIAETNNGNVDPVRWTSLNNGYLTSQVYALSIGPNNQIMAGFQDNSTWLTVSDQPLEDWTDQWGGDGAYNAFSSDGVYRWVSSQNGNVYRLTYTGGADDISADDVRAFVPSSYESQLFIAPLYLDPADDNLFYLGGDFSLYVNTEAISGSGSSGWKSIELGSNGVVSEIGTSRVGKVYIGTSNGELYQIENVGSEELVTEITGGNFPTAYISGIGVNELNPNEILVTFSNYSIPSIFYTNDGGANWADVGGNLEENPDGTGNGPSVRIARILGNGDKYFVGTSTGLYSADAMLANSTIWNQESDNLIGNVVVEHLATRLEDGLVVAGTHGNGVYSAAFQTSGLPDNDLQVTSIISPKSGLMTSSELVSIQIDNVGSENQVGFELDLFLNDNVVSTEVFDDTLKAGTSAHFTFTSTLDLSVIGEYVIEVTIDNPDDFNLLNNSLTKNVQSLQADFSFPYNESFETELHQWEASDNVWQLGTPSAQTIVGASEGSRAWATILNGTYPNNSYSVLASPFFDFTGTIQPMVTFDINFDIEEDWDGFVFAYRTNISEDFQIVPDSLGIDNWYNRPEVFSFGDQPAWSGSSNGYVKARADISFLANEPFVQLALLFISDGFVVSDGVAFDNFSLTDSSTSSNPDRAPLVAFYEALNGDFWGASNNWLSSEPLENWFGIATNNEGRVTSITMPSNNLRGQLPPEIEDLSFLTSIGLPNNLISGELPEGLGNIPTLQRLGLRNNQLTGSIPNSIAVSNTITHINIHENEFTGLNNGLAGKSYASFQVQNNRLSFEDIVPLINEVGTYAPQALVDDPLGKSVRSGDQITLSVSDTTAGNEYQWFFNNQPIDGATEGNYTIDSYSEALAGTYHATIMNGAAPELTLTRNDITLITSSEVSFSIDNNTIFENQIEGTLVGRIIASDNLDYDFVLSGINEESFIVINDEIVSTRSFDFEEKNTYEIDIEVFRNNVSIQILRVTVLVLDMNEPPLDIQIDNLSIPEGEPAGTVIGTVTVFDQDQGDSHTLEITGNNESSFSVTDSQIISAETFNFNQTPTLQINLIATDEGANTFEKEFIISVDDINGSPTLVELSNTNIAEDAVVGEFVGALTTVDSDVNDSFTYSIGGDDAGSFAIENSSNLITNQLFDFETKDEYTISIMSTDAAGQSVETEFEISILDVNEAPTAILLEKNTVFENELVGTNIGSITVEDQDEGDSHTFSLSGANASSFQIENNVLVTADVFDFEDQSSYIINIIATDTEGLSFGQLFAIEVLDEAIEVTSLQQIESKVKAYPNPSDGAFILKFGEVHRNLRWSISDLTGKVVHLKGKAINTLVVEVNAQQLNGGIYLLTIRSEKGTYSQRISIIK